MEARGTKLFQRGQVVVERRAESIGRGGADMVVVARMVKEEPDWGPQWGVGRGGIREAFVSLGVFGGGGGMMGWEGLCLWCLMVLSMTRGIRDAYSGDTLISVGWGRGECSQISDLEFLLKRALLI